MHQPFIRHCTHFVLLLFLTAPNGSILMYHIVNMTQHANQLAFKVCVQTTFSYLIGHILFVPVSSKSQAAQAELNITSD